MEAKDFLGRGWAFPVDVGGGGGVALAEAEEDIKQAIRIILGTVLGERAMRPDFGCAVHELLFEPAEASLPGRAEFYVRNALDRWEPRVELERGDARIEGTRLLVDLEYRVRSTNRRDNLVSPYFFQGGE